MGLEEIIGILVIAVAWLIRLFASGAKRQQPPAPGSDAPVSPQPRRETREGPEREPQPAAARTAIELLRELGLDLEVETAPPPPSPPPAPALQAAPVAPAAPQAGTRGRRPAGGPRPVPLPPVPAIPPPTPARKREEPPPAAVRRPAARSRVRPTGLRDQVLEDLRSGAPSLARAIVLKEVLDSPPGLRPPGAPPER